MGVSANGSSRTLIELSRLVIALLGGSGCASQQSIVLDPAALPAAVEEYEARGETVVENAIAKQRKRLGSRTTRSDPNVGWTM
jgi:hypothetical protein